MLTVFAQNIKDYLAWCNSPAALTLILRCGHARYIRWGTYGRKPRPHGIEIRIQRFFCLICHHTCSVLPAFLLGHVHYTATTVSPYVDYMAAHPSASIAEAWAHDPADGFPRDLATLYRWFKRLAFRLTFLLTMLEKELLDLAPETDLASLEKLIVKRAAIRQPLLAAPSPADTTTATASALTLHASCQSSLELVKQLLRITDKLLHTSHHKKRPPLMALNLFCWQKTGQALLSPLPQKPKPPP
jgi:hypothetical protein